MKSEKKIPKSYQKIFEMRFFFVFRHSSGEGNMQSTFWRQRTIYFTNEMYKFIKLIYTYCYIIIIRLNLPGWFYSIFIWTHIHKRQLLSSPGEFNLPHAGAFKSPFADPSHEKIISQWDLNTLIATIVQSN